MRPKTEEIFHKVFNKQMSKEEALSYFEQIYHAEQEDMSAYPLSEGQKALWVISRMAPENYAYNVPLAFWVHPEIDLAALKRACQGLLDRHAVLRATMHEEDDGIVQTDMQHEEVFFKTVDVSGWSDSDILVRVKEESRTPFDLENGPLMKVMVFARAEGKNVVLIMFHHIVFDGMSVGIFIEELYKSYMKEREGARCELSALTATYADFVEWQRVMLASQDGAQHRDYWFEQLSGDIPALELPTDRPRPVIPTYHGETYSLGVNETLLHELEGLAISENATVFSVMMAAYMVLLHRYSHQEDITVGTPVAGRPEERFENVLGYFMNMVVVRGKLAGEPVFRELLKQVHGTILGALDHSDYPYMRLVKELRAAKKATASQLFQVAFYFQNWLNTTGDEDSMLAEKNAARDLFLFEPVAGIEQEGEFDLIVDVIPGVENILDFVLDTIPTFSKKRQLVAWQVIMYGY